MSPQEASKLKALAGEAIVSRATISNLTEKLRQEIRTAEIWRKRYEKLLEKTKDFLAALERSPRKVMEFIGHMLHAEPERTEPQKTKNRFREEAR